MCEINTGVPQGSILLFVIYVNGTFRASFILHAIVYADDTTLTANLEDFYAKTRKDLENNVNSEINKISIWLKANRLSLNIQKSKFMLYYKPPKRVPILVIKIQEKYQKLLELYISYYNMGVSLEVILYQDSHSPWWMNFADFSVNSQSIFMKFYTHYFPFMSWLPWKFHGVLISI